MRRPQIVSICILSLFGIVASAKEPSTYFGSGLHKFYQSDFEGAIDDLDLAESSGIKDGRLFYFRGIAKLRAGRDQAGRADLERGAQYEAKVGPRYVGLLLERLQESERSVLSLYRAKARLAASENENVDENFAELPEPQRKSFAAITVDVALVEDDTDPFRDDSLGRGELVELVADTADGDEFATSDSSTNLATDPDPFSEDDPGFGEFGDVDDFADANTDLATGTGPSPPSEKKKRGLFGSVFRAVGRSVIPDNAAEQLMRQIPIPGGPTMGPSGGPSPGTGDGDFAGFEESADPTGIDSTGLDEDSMSEDEGDPFSFDEDSSFEDSNPDEGNPFADDP